MGSDIYRVLKRFKKTHYDLTTLPLEIREDCTYMHNNKDVFLILFAIREAKYRGKVQVGMDVTASELYQDGRFDLDINDPSSGKAASICADASVYLMCDTDIQIVG